MDTTRRSHLLSLPRGVWTYVRRAPGSYLWLAVLFATTYLMRHLSPRLLNDFLGERSTNLHNLAHDPVRVLISSAFWLGGGGWILYFVAYNVFHVPAERWLGTLRWLGVVAVAHIGATYLSEGVLFWAIRHGHAPAAAADTLDVGVSYALAGVAAVLTYRVAASWRPLYAFCVLVFYGLPLVNGRTFTDIGHVSAVLLGFACFPLVRGRPGLGGWDPVAAARRLVRSARPAPRG
ncbi:rhomboid-like protein [Streptomyces sp. H27-D2]|uniref:rhomboid-like protein n=1 Tax=Streptomyces sp. H27-D2 TaxID=3046304 RepID=UPI002DB7D098|nr:rhomboid-like protein [Streptomyces sp. H27-D2]MEC4015294.1 rhomboid-like protein [Streptomyces sp. H27-D2]